MSAKLTDERLSDAGLLLLRIGSALSLAVLFGLPKLSAAVAHIHSGQPWPFIDFNRKLGLPAPVLVAYYQSLNESLIALLVVCGFYTRLAALSLAVGFAAATACSLKVGEPSWLAAAYYCLMFATILLTGPGEFSIDHLLKSRAKHTP
jgi:putative oxidoreductase